VGVTFNLLGMCEWVPVQRVPRAADFLRKWLESEPSESMWCAPASDRKWVGMLEGLLSPYGNVRRELCEEMPGFAAADDDPSYGRQHQAWLRSVGPVAEARVAIEMGEFLVSMTWAEYVDKLGDLGCLGMVIWSSSLDWGAIVHYHEFSVAFRPRWGAVERVVRVTHFRTRDGRLVSKDRVMIRLRSGEVWESGRLGHQVDADAVLTMAGAVSRLAGVEMETRELEPWGEASS
jgi:hypothetical protein